MEYSRKILVVDDAPMFRELEVLFLSRSGRVLTAGDGIEALDLARTERPDVVVADLEMPGMGGAELCERFKADPDLCATRIIAVTSGRDGEEHATAIRAGADDVLEKPIDRLSLIQAVSRLLRDSVRGLVRVPLETDVRLGLIASDSWGRASNVSRGGLFVELEAAFEPQTELDLEFRLPETPYTLVPTAKVAWRRPASGDRAAGMGLQFLKLEPDSAQRIDAYVYERSATESDPSHPGSSMILR